MNLPPLPSAEKSQTFQNPGAVPQPGKTAESEFSVHFDQAIATSNARSQPPQANADLPVPSQPPKGSSLAPQPVTQDPQAPAQAPAETAAQPQAANDPAQPSDSQIQLSGPPQPIAAGKPDKSQVVVTGFKAMTPQIVASLAGETQVALSDPMVEETPVEQGTDSKTGSLPNDSKKTAGQPAKKESQPDSAPVQPAILPMDPSMLWQPPAVSWVENTVSVKVTFSTDSAANETASIPSASQISLPQGVSQAMVGDTNSQPMTAQAQAQPATLASPQKEAAASAAPGQKHDVTPNVSKDGIVIPDELMAAGQDDLSDKEVEKLLASASPVPPTQHSVHDSKADPVIVQIGVHARNKAAATTASAPVAKQSEPLGTTVASSSKQMLYSHEQNDFAARTEQYLPETSAASKDAEKTASIKTVHPDATVQAASAIPFQIRPEEATVTPATSNHLKTDQTHPTTERLFNSISNEITLMRQIAPDKLNVVLRPDSDTQIALQLRVRNGAVEGTARCERGDYPLLSAHWTELQRSFDQKGIHLEPLRDSDFGFNYSGGSFGGSSHQDQDQRGRRLEQAIISEPFIVNKPITINRPASTEERSGKTLLQTWA